MMTTFSYKVLNLKRMATGILLLISCVLISQCTQLKYLFIDPLPPKVTLVELEVSEANLKFISVVATLKIENPNDFDFRATQTHFEVWHEKTMLAESQHPNAIVVPASNELKVKLPAKIMVMGALSVLGNFLSGTKELMLETRTKTTFESDFANFDLDFIQSHPIKL